MVSIYLCEITKFKRQINNFVCSNSMLCWVSIYVPFKLLMKICHLIFFSFCIPLYVQFNVILYWICFHVPINCVNYGNWYLDIFSYYFMFNFYTLHTRTRFIGGSSNVITYNMYRFHHVWLLKSINKCGTGMQAVTFGGFVKTHPSRRFFIMLLIW